MKFRSTLLTDLQIALNNFETLPIEVVYARRNRQRAIVRVASRLAIAALTFTLLAGGVHLSMARAYTARAASAKATTSVWGIDPVCHRRFDARTAAGTCRIDGQVFTFDSVACQQSFLQAPMRYCKTRGPAPGIVVNVSSAPVRPAPAVATTPRHFTPPARVQAPAAAAHVTAPQHAAVAPMGGQSDPEMMVRDNAARPDTTARSMEQIDDAPSVYEAPPFDLHMIQRQEDLTYLPTNGSMGGRRRH